MKNLFTPNEHSTGSPKSRQQVADGPVTSEAISGRDSSLACHSGSPPGQCPPRSPGSRPGESQGTQSGSYRLPMTAWSRLPAKRIPPAERLGAWARRAFLPPADLLPWPPSRLRLSSKPLSGPPRPQQRQLLAVPPPRSLCLRLVSPDSAAIVCPTLATSDRRPYLSQLRRCRRGPLCLLTGDSAHITQTLSCLPFSDTWPGAIPPSLSSLSLCAFQKRSDACYQAHEEATGSHWGLREGPISHTLFLASN